MWKEGLIMMILMSSMTMALPIFTMKTNITVDCHDIVNGTDTDYCIDDASVGNTTIINNTYITNQTFYINTTINNSYTTNQTIQLNNTYINNVTNGTGLSFNGSHFSIITSFLDGLYYPLVLNPSGYLILTNISNKLNATDQRYNDTALINTKGNISGNGANNTISIWRNSTYQSFDYDLQYKDNVLILNNNHSSSDMEVLRLSNNGSSATATAGVKIAVYQNITEVATQIMNYDNIYWVLRGTFFLVMDGANNLVTSYQPLLIDHNNEDDIDQAIRLKNLGGLGSYIVSDNDVTEHGRIGFNANGVTIESNGNDIETLRYSPTGNLLIFDGQSEVAGYRLQVNGNSTVSQTMFGNGVNTTTAVSNRLNTTTANIFGTANILNANVSKLNVTTQLAFSNKTNTVMDRCTLVGGKCKIPNTQVTTNTFIYCTARTVSGTATTMYDTNTRQSGNHYNVTGGALDTSLINCLLVEPIQ